MQSTAIQNQPVYIVGAGGIGVVLGWCLQASGVHVTMVENVEDKVKVGRKTGLGIAGHDNQYPDWVLFDEWHVPDDAIIILCTKTYNNDVVLQKLGRDSLLIPVQNGFDTDLDALGHGIEGIVSFVSECERRRPVTRITRAGDFHLGPRRSLNQHESTVMEELAGLLTQSGLFKVHLVDDIYPYKYAKLMYNAAISPLAAGAGIDNGELLADPLAQRLFYALLKENYQILKRAGIELATIGPLHPDTVNRILTIPLLPRIMAVFFKPSLRGTYCSMAPDITTGHTEIDAYNGYLIHLAGRHPCPLNRAAHDMINTIVRDGLPPSRDNLVSLYNRLCAGEAA